MPLLERLLEHIGGKPNYCAVNVLHELENSTKIKIDEIVKYFYEVSSKEKWDDNEFVNIAPPFESFWMEYSLPEYSNNEGRRMYFRSQERKIKFGYLFRYFKCKESEFENRWMVVVMSFSNIGEILNSLNAIFGTDVSKPIGIAAWFLDRNGSIIPIKYLRENGIKFAQGMFPENDVFSFTNEYEKLMVDLTAANSEEDSRGMYFIIPSQNREIAEFSRSLIDTHISVCLFAVYLMHCKNVTIKKNIYPDHEIREYQKRYGKTPVKFYTIDIEPAKTILRNQGGIHQVGLQKALHLCRGHFKHFEEGSGLFGKYHGTYWWPQIMRGSKEFGEVKKDYNVKAPTVGN